MSPRKLVVVVTGNPQAGKDTAVGYMRAYLNALHGGITNRTMELSSIDCVRHLLLSCGFDVSKKTSADRDLLAEVGASLEKYNSFRTKHVCKIIDKFFVDSPVNAIAFIYVREQSIITYLRFRYPVIVLKVQRPEELEIITNASDRDVKYVNYDLCLDNNGTLDNLGRISQHLAASLIEDAEQSGPSPIGRMIDE